MFIYYRNSILATVVSVFGCALAGFGYTREDYLLMVIGVVLVIGGKVISAMKK